LNRQEGYNVSWRLALDVACAAIRSYNIRHRQSAAADNTGKAVKHTCAVALRLYREPWQYSDIEAITCHHELGSFVLGYYTWQPTMRFMKHMEQRILRANFMSYFHSEY